MVEYENGWRLILPVDNIEFIYRFAQRKEIAIYDMGMHEYRFELEGAYLPVDVEKYLKKQRENLHSQLQQSRYEFWKMPE